MENVASEAAGDSRERINVSVTINLDALLGTLQGSIKRVTNLVALGSQSPIDLSPEALEIAAEPMRLRIGETPLWTSTEAARNDYNDWLFGCGLRDVSESVSEFLEGVRKVAAYWSIRRLQDSGVRVTGEHWNRQIIDGEKKFHRLGFPDKVEALANEFGIGVAQQLTDHVLSANAARNCIVHRAGVVADRDVNENGHLAVSWRKMVLLLEDEDGTRPLVLGEVLQKEATVLLTHETATKKFPLGARVSFAPGEFMEICWSMYFYGVAWAQILNEYGTRHGLVDPKPAPQPGAQSNAA